MAQKSPPSNLQPPPSQSEPDIPGPRPVEAPPPIAPPEPTPVPTPEPEGNLPALARPGAMGMPFRGVRMEAPWQRRQPLSGAELGADFTAAPGLAFGADPSGRRRAIEDETRVLGLMETLRNGRR